MRKVDMPSQFYVYLHARPDKSDLSSVFYVGKGTGRRYRSRCGRNAHYESVVAKCGGFANVMTSKIECSSEEIAFALEKGLIRLLLRSGVNLTNKTLGGEGLSGYSHTKETRAKMAARTLSEETRTKIRDKLTGIKRSEEFCKAISERLSGENNQWYGKTFTDAHKKKLSEARKGKPLSEPAKQKLRLCRGDKHFAFGSELADSHKSKISAAMLGKRNTAGKKWMSNGELNKLVASENIKTFEMNGWVIGRSKMRGKSYVKGMIWIIKSGVRKRVKPEDLAEYVGNGWLIGTNE